MPKTYENVYGTSRAPFLASEVGKKLETKDMTAYATSLGVEETDAYGHTYKVIKAGTVYPTNGAGAIGIVFEDVYEFEGAYIGSLMTGGYVLKERLHTSIQSAAITALKGLGLFVVEGKETVRPDYGTGELVELGAPTIQNAGGTISWSAVTNARGYAVCVNDVVAKQVSGTSESVTSYTKAGDKITVFALGDYINTKNGKASNVVTL